MPGTYPGVPLTNAKRFPPLTMFRVQHVVADCASARFIPPAFGDVVEFLHFGQLLDLVARVAKHAIKNAASGVLAVVVAIVGQFDHAFSQQNDLSEMVVTRFHGLKLSEGVGRRRPVRADSITRENIKMRAKVW